MNADCHRAERALIEIAEREQGEIGQQLHDTLCQSLGGISIVVRLLARRIRSGKRIEPTELDDLGDTIDRAFDEARALSRKLHPVQLDAAGLIAALDEFAQKTGKTASCRFEYRDCALIHDSKIAVTLYRIAEEAVKSAVVNGGADQIVISLGMRKGCPVLEVNDNGAAPGSAERATRLDAMCSRANAIGARLTSLVEAGKGSTIICTLPPNGMPARHRRPAKRGRDGEAA